MSSLVVVGVAGASGASALAARESSGVATAAAPSLVSLDPCPTIIEITQAPAWKTGATTVPITVSYYEDDSQLCLSAGIEDWTFRFLVNGTDRTSYFSVGMSSATASAVPLVSGVLNTLIAEIDGYAPGGTHGTRSDTTATYQLTLDLSVVAGATSLEPSQGTTIKYLVENASTQSASLTFSCAVTGPVTCGTVSPSSQTLAASQAVEVSVPATATTGTGAATVKLLTAGDVADTLAHAITLGYPPRLSLAYTDGSRQLRGGCPTIGAGGSAAVQCGDLLYAHGFPSYRSMNEARGLTLLYNSATAHPTPAVVVNYHTRPGDRKPQSVRVEVYRKSPSTLLRTVYFDTTGFSDTTVAKHHRLVVPLDAVTLGLATGAHPVEVRVSRKWGGACQPADTGSTRLLVVDRRNSPFGAGWWPAGVERLYPGQANGAAMLVLGDGSALVFDSTGASTFGAPAGEHSVLTKAGTRFERALPGGRVTIKYDASGFVDTIADNNPTRNKAVYSWTVGGPDGKTLTKITDPAGKEITFALSSGRVNTISIPAVNTITLHQGTASGNIASLDSLSDPDGFRTKFTYASGTRRMSSSTARGLGTFSYTYDVMNRVDSAKVPGHDVGAPVGSSKKIRAWQLVGAPTATTGASEASPAKSSYPDSARLVVSWKWGTGTNLATDSAWFRVGPVGAPVVVKAPLVEATLIERDSVGQPIRITTAGGVDVEQRYDANGNLTHRIEKNALGWSSPTTFRYDTTRYVYNATWRTVDSIIPADGKAKVTFEYDSYGRREAVVDANGRRTKFEYKGNGLLWKITEPHHLTTQTYENIPTTYAYDSTSGGAWNLLSVSDSAGGVTYGYDATTRTELRTVTDAHGNVTSYTYDNVKRPLSVVQDPIDTDTTAIVYAYNDVARTRTQTDPLGKVSTWYHDLAGRVWKTCLPGNLCDVTTYGDGLNPTVLEMRDGTTDESTISQEFDAAGRVKHKEIGLDDAIDFRYDSAGRLTEIDNLYSRIRRVYDPYGRLTCERQEIRHWMTATSFAGATAWYEYDRAGRRHRTFYGSVACTSTVPTTDTMIHNYDAVGRLDSLRWTAYDASTSERWRWHYDGKGRLDTLFVPSTSANMYDMYWKYDPDDRLYSYRPKHQGEELLVLDALGRTTQKTWGNNGNQRDDYGYDGLGRLKLVENSSHGNNNTYLYDRAGNRLGDKKWEYHYDGVTGRMTGKTDTTSSSCHADYEYDTRGNQTEVDWGTSACSSTDGRSMQYDDGNRLTWSETRLRPGGDGTRDEHRTFWYDGLGRRIAMLSSHLSASDAGMWRYFWFADHVGVKVYNNTDTTWTGSTYEIDADWPRIHRDQGSITGEGEWFVYGPGTDNVIGSIHLVGKTSTHRRLYIADSRGSILEVMQPNGTGVSSSDSYGPWGSANTGTNEGVAGFNGQEAAGGLVYMRNRWYDPNSGRFTQEDPAGFSGGINLYGYAGNDPVNYSDPFGLCPEKLKDQDGNCPGDLTVEQWQKLESSARQHLKDGAREKALGMLEGGQIGAKDLPRHVNAESSVGLFGGARITFDSDRLNASSKDVAGTFAHELGHIEHTRTLNPLERLQDRYFYDTDPLYKAAIENIADGYKRLFMK